MKFKTYPFDYPLKITHCKTVSYFMFCDRERIRTPNPQSRNLIFYPVELRGLYLLL